MLLITVAVSLIVIGHAEEIETTGKWQHWGGNLKNQQIALYASKHFNKQRLKQQSSRSLYQIQCKYNGISRQNGPINVDNNDNAIFVDWNYLISYNLKNCTENWSRNIAQLLGYDDDSNFIITGRDFVSIYRKNDDEKFDNYSILLGAPNSGNFSFTGNGCFAISVSGNDGSVEWILNLGNGIKSMYCFAHGFTIDGMYAYGGISSRGWLLPYNQHGFQGKMVKINLLNASITNVWYTADPSIFPNGRADNSSYTGGGIWGWTSIIDEYLIFGTGNFLSVPDYVNDCFRSNGSDINYDTYPFNPCGEDVREDTLYWKCMENGTYPSSLIVLNKTDFSLQLGVPLVGMDVWNNFGGDNFGGFSNSNNTAAFIGSDSDLAAVSSYYDKETGHMFAAGINKAGMFYTFDINTKEIRIAKKVGPWGPFFGTMSLAIDEENLIAIATNIGGSGWGDDVNDYRYRLADGNIICKGGIVHAIDLRTGHTKWQFVDPYALMNNNSLCYPDGGRYVDVTQPGQCERTFNGDDMLNASQTAKVIYGEQRLPVPIDLDARMRGNAVIVNDLVLLPSQSGDVHIIDIINGEYIDSIGCPNWNIGIDNITNQTIWHRLKICNMPTVYNDGVILWCSLCIDHGEYIDSIPPHLVYMKMNIGLHEDKGLNQTQIILIVTACIFGIILIGIIIYCMLKRKIIRNDTYQSIH